MKCSNPDPEIVTLKISLITQSMCEMCASESERDVSLLVLREKLKSPPATVSGESQDSPAPGSAACRPAVTCHLSTLQSPVKDKIKRRMIVRRIWETDWTTSISVSVVLKESISEAKS